MTNTNEAHEVEILTSRINNLIQSYSKERQDVEQKLDSAIGDLLIGDDDSPGLRMDISDLLQIKILYHNVIVDLMNVLDPPDDDAVTFDVEVAA